jgi:hypothetical protein
MRSERWLVSDTFQPEPQEAVSGNQRYLQKSRQLLDWAVTGTWRWGGGSGDAAVSSSGIGQWPR